MAPVGREPARSDCDWIEVAHYLLVQAQVEEGLAAFDRVSREKIVARTQYDYMHAIVQMLRGDLAGARATAQNNLDCRVCRTRTLTNRRSRPSCTVLCRRTTRNSRKPWQ